MFGKSAPVWRSTIRPGAGPAKLSGEELSRAVGAPQEKEPAAAVRSRGVGRVPGDVQGGKRRAGGGLGQMITGWIRRLGGRGNPFQTEAALRRMPVVSRIEGVRVERNDLTDTDFELRPIGRGGGERPLEALDFRRSKEREDEGRRVRSVSGVG
jgi:hypothetical protein